MVTNSEARKIIIKNIITNKKDSENSILPIHFIELFDRELNCGLHILRDDCTRILKNKMKNQGIEI